jgi:hypothetical protein
LTTAPQGDIAARTFQVTHPFHPWHGRQFQLVAYKSAWGEDRVYFYDEEAQLRALPASWTDAAASDPFVTIAAGRAPFRAGDLLDLVRLVRCLSSSRSNDV